MTKDGSNMLFGKEIIISEATPKIGNSSIYKAKAAKCIANHKL